MSTVITKSYNGLPICREEILRYAGAKSSSESLDSLLSEAITEAEKVLSYKVCYIETDVTVTGSVADFGFFKVPSRDLVKNLSGCDRVIIFAATVGIGIDRLISKYSRISATRALLFQAIGAERIEALCDAFTLDLKEEKNISVRPRFSVGYGDSPLSAQKDILNLLDANRHIGITLNESMLMSPTKSVTAFIGFNK